MIFHQCRHILIDVVVVESARTAEYGAEVLVQIVGAPEKPLAALDLDAVAIARSAVELGFLAVEAQGLDQARSGAEEGPAVVQAGAGEDVEAGAEEGLNARESGGLGFAVELLLGGLEVLNSDTLN